MSARNQISRGVRTIAPAMVLGFGIVAGGAVLTGCQVEETPRDTTPRTTPRTEPGTDPGYQPGTDPGMQPGTQQPGTRPGSPDSP